MFTRLTTITGATKLDDGIAYIRDTVVPTLQQQKGYAGLVASVGRAEGFLAVLSVWEDQASRDASESGIAKVRGEAQQITGGTLALALHEQVVFEEATPITPGCALLVRRATMAPAAVEDNLAHFRTSVLPQIKAEPGFCAVRQLVDRTAGETMVAVVLEDETSLRSAVAHAEERRADAEARGITLHEPSQREVVLVDRP